MVPSPGVGTFAYVVERTVVVVGSCFIVLSEHKLAVLFCQLDPNQTARYHDVTNGVIREGAFF